VANNLALEIEPRLNDKQEKLKYLNKVIQSSSTQSTKYNKYRAVGKKVILLEGKVDQNLLEGNLLSEAYTYSFGQRMKNMFDSSHEAIWLYFYAKNDVDNLSVLFKQSSIYWRVNDDEESEKRYAALLELLIQGVKLKILDPYTRARLKLLKSYI